VSFCRSTHFVCQRIKVHHSPLYRIYSIYIYKASRIVAYLYLIAIVDLIIFFGRGGGNNIDKILAATKDFQSSLDKLVFIAQGFSVKSVDEYLHSPIIWLVRKLAR